MRFGLNRIDRVGVVVALIAAYGLVAPFALFRANRIVQGEGRSLFSALPPSLGAILLVLSAIAIVMALLRLPLFLKLLASLVMLAVLAFAIGNAAGFLTPEGNNYARVSPGSGFWLLSAAFALLATDCLARLRPPPWMRIAILTAIIAAIAFVLASGLWDGLSILKEYSSRADTFWLEAGRHVTLALGSLAVAAVVGIPLGILCHRVEPARSAILNLLNIVQTIPSIALFGILIGPLSWVAANVPGAADLGIRGIGMAPAFLALFLYSLLPMVANTVGGLAGVPAEANDAARGVGMTDRQRLTQVELPLAFPVILTGIRIVLVQNIGLATIAALIGGGGFGVFVFQGLGQTAMDLVLLGAVPTVTMAFAAAVILDAIVELVAPANAGSGTGRKEATA
ncbi:ABC transporter permease subunit [Rhizobiales bacterium RZME27]|uniref:ABC transporter permease subunit n=1 Tax=Endobacterium cereale TaxID=2663029 RepID=A0A6A8A598_9HYPH|nr:ABC transporter permease [Endobacterium cereale]MEB2845096.1 ABC transporter permease [Endobacterium cereale]MQY45008.1 ABC transporter permease subunit [Endobacterium cereale]